MHKHQVHVPALPAGTPAPDFRKGELALVYETSAYRLVQWAESIGGLSQMYVTPPPRKQRPFTATLGTSTALFRTRPQQQEAAWQVLRWITATEPSAAYAVTAMYPPVRRSVLKVPAYQKMLEDVPQFQTFIDQQAFAYRPYHPEFRTHYDRIKEMSAAILKEPRAVKQELDAAARDVARMLEEFAVRHGARK